MTGSADEIVCLSCSVFKPILQRLQSEGALRMPVEYVDSMLHMRPPELGRVLTLRVEALTQLGKWVLLVYGDCHSHMADYSNMPHVYRVTGANCPEILLGSELYRRLRHDGAFFLMGEWVHRWHEVFEQRLGLKGETAKDFMREMHRQLVYLDTGDTPVPMADLEALSQFAGLPFVVQQAEPEALRKVIDECLMRMPR
jgi:Protein of unknown function (DUF1638)